MPNYEEMYFKLFGAISDVMEILDKVQKEIIPFGRAVIIGRRANLFAVMVKGKLVAAFVCGKNNFRLFHTFCHKYSPVFALSFCSGSLLGLLIFAVV